MQPSRLRRRAIRSTGLVLIIAAGLAAPASAATEAPGDRTSGFFQNGGYQKEFAGAGGHTVSRFEVHLATCGSQQVFVAQMHAFQYTSSGSSVGAGVVSNCGSGGPSEETYYAVLLGPNGTVQVDKKIKPTDEMEIEIRTGHGVSVTLRNLTRSWRVSDGTDAMVAFDRYFVGANASWSGTNGVLHFVKNRVDGKSLNKADPDAMGPTDACALLGELRAKGRFGITIVC